MRRSQIFLMSLAVAACNGSGSAADADERDVRETAEVSDLGAGVDVSEVGAGADVSELGAGEELVEVVAEVWATGFASLIPGPGQEGFDAALEAKATAYERQFHALNALPMALNADMSVTLTRVEDRELIRAFLQDTDDWDFKASTGKDPTEVVTAWHKVAGLYGGVGIGADAYRYGVLRDNGYPQEEVDRAREFLIADLDMLHMATAITGVPGVIARGFMRTDIQGDGVNQEVVPLFDQQGNPLPEEKNNGTWRADESGLYPNYHWEDSCSRDMYIGWAAAFAASWEVMSDDPSFAGEMKERLKTDARDIVRELMVVRESGYDLEIPDADGRTTYHGYMNENNIDRIYVPGIRNGFYAIMALGSVASLNYVAEDEEVDKWLYESLLAERELDVISYDDQSIVNRGVQSNFSNQNMAFMGGWLALRYINKDPDARKMLVKAVSKSLYDDGTKNQPAEMKQSFFDVTHVAGSAGATAWSGTTKTVDAEAVENAVQTLNEFPDPPFWELGKDNCDEAEIAAGVCTLNDGSVVNLVGNVGWGDKLVAESPIPMAIRHPSNYHWRSNPYEPNGTGDGTRLLPGVDFRWAYWMGRWAKLGE